MGVYMSKPIQDKESADFDGKLLRCGASSMQGWRVSQEDAHNCCMDFDGETSLFAVYDGHGGHEVAEYASKHLPNFLKENEAYKAGDFNTALIDSFLQFDASLKTESVMEELARIAKDGKQKNKDGPGTSSGEGGDSDDETDVAKLREEASIPIADVIAMYANNMGMPPKTPKNKLLGLGSSKPMSPFLRAVKPGSSSKDSEVSSSSSAPSSSLTNGVAEEAGSSKPESGSSSKPESDSSSKPESDSSSKSETVDSSKPETSDKSEPETSKPSAEEPTSNGETEGSASGCTSSAPEVSSSSAINGEVVGSSNAKEEPASSSSSPSKSKKEGSSRKKSGLSAILDSTIPSDDEDSSNDEPFQPNEEVASSSDDDDDEVHLNGSKDSEEEDEDDDGDGEEAEEESEEEIDDEELEEEDDDFVVKGGPEEPGMDSGCTAVVALVTKDKLYVANAGDSRAVLCRNGTAVDLSVDHKPEDPIELKRIQNAGGKVTNDGRVNGGLNLSRALGDHFYKRSADLDAREQMITALPDVVTESIDRSVDEFIVLACDGIWNSMSSQEVVDFVRPLVKKGETLSSICEKLFEACLAPDTCGDGTGCDNMTCVIVKILPTETEAVTSKRRSPDPEDGATDTQPESKKPKLSAEPQS